MYKLFGEIKIGDKFTYMVNYINRYNCIQEEVFIKTGNNTAKLEKLTNNLQESFKFNYNDTVKVINS